MRLVLDTNIVVAALRSPSGGSAELVRRVRAGAHRMLVSVPLFLQYEAVVMRPEHLLAAQVSTRDASNFLDALALLGEPVKTHYLWRSRLRDAADDMVLEAAVNGRADAIVTFNTADFGSAPGAFGVALMSPAGVLGN